MTDLSWALELIRGLGIAGGPVFAILWWIERSERVAVQKETRELLVQTLTITNHSANAVNAVSAAVATFGEGTKDSITSLSQLIRSLNRARST